MVALERRLGHRERAAAREHPRIRIDTAAVLPKAWVGGEEYTRPTLRSLLDKLDELMDEQDRARGAPRDRECSDRPGWRAAWAVEA
jgi:hypothetical protein